MTLPEEVEETLLRELQDLYKSSEPEEIDADRRIRVIAEFLVEHGSDEEE